MIRTKLQNIVRGDIKGNLSNKFRQNRINLFMNLLTSKNIKGLKILDVGGTDYHWRTLDIDNTLNFEIILLNPEDVTQKHPQFRYVKGDGRNLSLFENGSIDVVYSNSVIEHVGEWKDQLRFAQEIKRISRSYFVQTPNYFFPFEPHFLTMGIHYLPVKVRAVLIRHFNLGWYNKIEDYSGSISLAKSIRLLKYNELRRLFPGAKIIKEKFLWFTKSFMIYEGF